MNRAATVRSWDPVVGGDAYLDDGTVVLLTPECLQGSAFRFLRPGQRVVADVVDGTAVHVDLPG